MIEFTPTELKAFREELFKGFSDSQFDLAISECQRRDLVPGQHIHFQLRTAKEWVPEMNTSITVKKLTKVTTIDAFRLLSQRTGEYEGQGKARWTYIDEKGEPAITSTVPLPDKVKKGFPREPWSCAVPVYRKGFREAIEVEARFDAYAVYRKMGDKQVLTDMWARRGPEMLAKCSEAASRRIAYPAEFASTYLREELEKDEAENVPAPAPPIAAVEPPKPTAVPEVNHTPAVPTDAPRPNEKPAAEVTLTDVLLPKKSNPRAKQVQTAVETYMEGQGKPLPKHEQPVEPYVPIGATDDDLPAEMFTADASPEPAVSVVENPVQKMDELTGDEIKAKVRSYDVHGVTRDQMKKFSLKVSGAKEPKEISKQQWSDIFGQLDAAAKEGKQSVLNLVKS